MAKLRDPDLAAGEIVEKREDGVWVRNDGVELQPAEKNPWYVLATVYGEYTDGYDVELAAKNRRIWNGWACSDLNSQAREKWVKQMGLSSGDLDPLTTDEENTLNAAFEDRLDEGVEVPEAGRVDLSKVYFSSAVVWEKYVFPNGANFFMAHFAGTALFQSALFASGSNFRNAFFARRADFSSTHFSLWVDFVSAHFENWGDFASARFAGWANFRSAIFVGWAEFSTASFARWSSFIDGAFKGSTTFQDARFLGRVPRFQQRVFHDDTNFTQEVFDKSGKRFWPEVPDDRASALGDKNAYRRLRQVSAEQHNTEAEHFFLRREMACAAELQPNRFSKWIIKAFGFFSDYGYSVGWPVFWLLMVWIVGASIIHGVFGWYHVMGWSLGAATGMPGTFDAYGLGFSNTFAIFGFRSFYLGDEYMTDLPAFVKIVGGLQTILGFVFLFFLGLGLRNRFRLK